MLRKMINNQLFKMQLTGNKITEIFYLVDEFCQEFSKSVESALIGNQPKKRPRMTYREGITILVLFHSGGSTIFISTT